MNEEMQITSNVHTWALSGPKGMLVSINLDTGEHAFGENYTPSDAARAFWNAVSLHMYDEAETDYPEYDPEDDLLGESLKTHGNYPEYDPEDDLLGESLKTQE